MDQSVGDFFWTLNFKKQAIYHAYYLTYQSEKRISSMFLLFLPMCYYIYKPKST